MANSDTLLIVITQYKAYKCFCILIRSQWTKGQGGERYNTFYTQNILPHHQKKTLKTFLYFFCSCFHRIMKQHNPREKIKKSYQAYVHTCTIIIFQVLYCASHICDLLSVMDNTNIYLFTSSFSQRLLCSFAPTVPF